jgi:hypothetical protein
MFEIILSVQEITMIGISEEQRNELLKVNGYINRIVKIESAVKEAKYNLAVVHAANLMTDFLKANEEEYVKKLIRIIALASNIASAQDSESVAKAIEDFADPVGSFKWKRNEACKVYFSLNGYMGGAYGWDRLSDDAFNKVNHFSVFAPV